MPFVSRWSNNYSSTLAAAVADTTTTTVTVASAAGLPSLTVPAGAIPAVVAVLVDSEIMHVTGISGTTLTVLRGQDSTTAATHASGATVTAVVTRDTLYNNSAPGAVQVTIPTGTQTYTPDLTYKYHFLTLGGATTLTINPPAAGPIPVQIGDEIRFHFTITATALTTQPIFHSTTVTVTCYDRASAGTAQGTITLTAAARSGFSFAYVGPTISSNFAWRRIT